VVRHVTDPLRPPGPDSPQSAFLDWAVAGRPLPGQPVSGDLAVVQVTRSRCVIAVIDGLGHGPEAAKAATLATGVIERHRAEPPEAMLLLVHEHLAESRGAAATLAIVDGDTGRMEWLGVGNVDGLVIRADKTVRPRTIGVFLCRGILGYQQPNIRPQEPVQLENGDYIVIATDGVRGDLAADVRHETPVDRMATALLDAHATPDDDALVLVARYRAAPAATSTT
jgi:serine phosphatase RsbU (regulator of sigma subunit)